MIDIPGITSAVATPAIWLNEETMAKYRAELKKYYYNPTKYKNDLDQFGDQVPDNQVKCGPPSGGPTSAAIRLVSGPASPCL